MNSKTNETLNGDTHVARTANPNQLRSGTGVRTFLTRRQFVTIIFTADKKPT